MTTPTQTSPAARLRSLMDHGTVAMPGSFNGLCARAVAQAGFAATYVSGAATSVCAGVPDVGLLTLEHFCRVIREVADGSGLPLIADADTGFGEAEMVRRTVIEYARAGAAGLHLEDQQFPKRCGHLDGKALVPTDHMVEKVQWAAKAAREVARCRGVKVSSGTSSSTPGHHDTPAPSPDSLIICARTDARGVEGFDAAVTRATAYVNAGADMIFPEGLTTEREFGEFATKLRSATAGRRVYLLANMTEFGKTPIIPVNRFAELGYDCVIFPVSLLRIAMGAVADALKQLKADGSVQNLLGEMQTREELYTLINYKPGVPWEFLKQK